MQGASFSDRVVVSFGVVALPQGDEEGKEDGDVDEDGEGGCAVLFCLRKSALASFVTGRLENCSVRGGWHGGRAKED